MVLLWFHTGFLSVTQDEGPSISTHRLALTMLIKIVKSLGCAYGCGEGHRGLSGDRLRHQVFRENVRKLKLIKMFPLYFWHRLLRFVCPLCSFFVLSTNVFLFVWAHRLCCSPAVADFQLSCYLPYPGTCCKNTSEAQGMFQHPMQRLCDKLQIHWSKAPCVLL